VTRGAGPSSLRTLQGKLAPLPWQRGTAWPRDDEGLINPNRRGVGEILRRRGQEARQRKAANTYLSWWRR